MSVIKKILKAIFFPHIAIVLFIDLLVAFYAVYASAILPILNNIRIMSYIILPYTTILTLCAIPTIITRITSRRIRTSYIKRLRFDTQFKINLSLYGTLAYNALYASFQLFTGISYNSVWYLAIAAYYTLLAIIRFSLFLYSRANKAGEHLETEYKRFRFCGILLLCMNAALSAITFYITWQNQELKHHSSTTIIFAIFTFISFTLAVVNIIRYRKLKSPLFLAAKLICLVSTVVSMLALETAIIGRFSSQISDEVRQIITGVTGVGVLTVTACVGLFMTIRGTHQLQKLKKSADSNQGKDNNKEQQDQ